MRNAEFNKGMDDYMKQRKRVSDYSYLDQSSPEPEPQIEDTPVDEHYYDEPSEEVSTDKPGFFKRVKKFFGGEDKPTPEEPQYDEPTYDEHEPCKEDLKRLGKITLNVLRLLPDRELVSFKNSDEYLALKDILTRNKLVK